MSSPTGKLDGIFRKKLGLGAPFVHTGAYAGMYRDVATMAPSRSTSSVMATSSVRMLKRYVRQVRAPQEHAKRCRAGAPGG